MRNRSIHLIFLVVAGAAAALVAACGGGGGGSSVAPPTPTPTPTYNANQAACVSQSGTPPSNCGYTFQSNEAGIAVYVGGTLIGSTGATPIATNPPFSNTPLTVSFGNGANAYTVTIAQNASASHAIYYNATADTGALSMTGNQSVARRTQSVIAEVRRRMAAAQTSATSPTGVYVKYDSSKLSPSRGVAQIEAAAGAQSGVDVLSSVAAVRGRVVRVGSGTTLQAMTARLQQEAAVTGVYPLHYRVPLTLPTPPAQETNPNDVYFDGGMMGVGTNNVNYECLQSTMPLRCQWDMQIIHADYAWYYTHGPQARIAILDTGADVTHPDLAQIVAFQATTAQTNGVEIGAGDGQAYSASGSVITATSPPQSTYAAAQDTNGHGTNVAGIADAQTNDDYGFAGVAYGGQAPQPYGLYIYRIFPPAMTCSGPTCDEQSADTGDEATAIADAVSRNVDVINLSLGAPQVSGGQTDFDQAEYDAVENAISAGVVVVAAAGNEYATTLDYPAAYDGVISVAATSLDDGQTNGSGVSHSGASPTSPVEYVASYANSGPGLAVVAPGGDPCCTGSDSDFLHWVFNDSTSTAADPNDACKPLVGTYDVCKALFAGTSQATPHVTGAVGLIQSALRQAGMSTLTPAQMAALLEGTADNIGDPRQGHGRLDVLRALESALGYSLTPLTYPTSSPAQFVAFAYTNSGATNAAPAIADVYYTHGAPVSSTGTFRIADINPAVTAGTFKIGVWLDANGDGKVDAGDQFGAATVTCTATTACHPGTITVAPVTSSSFTLP